jgi:PAS domain S-box-containing protein
MAKRQTHKTVEKKIKSLEKENKSLRQLVEKLQESEEKFKTIVENANDEIIYVGMDGTIIEINDKCEELFGLKRKEVIGKNFAEFGYFDPEDMEKAIEDFNDILNGGSPRMAEYRASRKDGHPVFIEVNPKLIEKDGEILGILTIIRDITGRKQIEEELEKYRDHLEDLVKERTDKLEDANTALRVMLKQAQEVKTEIEEKILFNVRKFVLPYIYKLGKGKLSETQKVYLENLEENLNDITSPYMHGISTKYLKLTPTEINVANLVKQGKTTKEIADLLHMSTKTIDAHRYSIRRKLGLTNKKDNLRTYLLST